MHQCRNGLEPLDIISLRGRRAWCNLNVMLEQRRCGCASLLLIQNRNERYNLGQVQLIFIRSSYMFTLWAILAHPLEAFAARGMVLFGEHPEHRGNLINTRRALMPPMCLALDPIWFPSGLVHCGGIIIQGGGGQCSFFIIVRVGPC